MSKLNANAEPFVPATIQAAQQRAEAGHHQHAPEAQQLEHASNGDERSLFMTFSNGSPLTYEEIYQHFTSLYGQCVEHIYVHKRENEDPKFGKIIFKTSNVPRMLLQKKEVVKISVNKKPVWLKEYVPKSLRNNS